MSEQHFYHKMSWTPTLCHIQLALVSNLTQTKSIIFHPCGVLMLTPSDSQGGQIRSSTLICHLFIAKLPYPDLLPCYLSTLKLTLRDKHSSFIYTTSLFTTTTISSAVLYMGNSFISNFVEKLLLFPSPCSV